MAAKPAGPANPVRRTRSSLRTWVRQRTIFSVPQGFSDAWATPEVPVCGTSSFPRTHSLQKPFTPAALARKVRAVLDAPASGAGAAAAPEGGKTWPAAGPWWAYQRPAAGRLGSGRCRGRATPGDPWAIGEYGNKCAGHRTHTSIRAQVAVSKGLSEKDCCRPFRRPSCAVPRRPTDCGETRQRRLSLSRVLRVGRQSPGRRAKHLALLLTDLSGTGMPSFRGRARCRNRPRSEGR